MLKYHLFSFIPFLAFFFTHTIPLRITTGGIVIHAGSGWSRKLKMVVKRKAREIVNLLVKSLGIHFIK